MSIAHIGELSKRLLFVEWTWQGGQVADSMSQLGWTFIRDVRHRKEYRIDEDTLASVYGGQGGEDPVDFIEITLAAFTDLESLDDYQYEDMIDRFYAMFRDAVKAVENELGKPVFCNGAAAASFPDDQDAVWLALWRSPTARLMVRQTHEDRELPFRVCLTIAPPMP